MAWPSMSCRLSITHRIFGGFGLLIAVFLVAVAILLRGQVVAEHVAGRIG